MTAAWRTGVLRGDHGFADRRALVVKMGGSLFGRPTWARDLPDLLDRLATPCLVVVGGGPLVAALRAIDRATPQPAHLVHRLAIDCMGVTARLVAATLGLPLVADDGAVGPPVAVLDAPAWLGYESRFSRLPVGWHVTSDSIAALAAVELRRGLLLAKSIPPPGEDLGRLAASGWVDDFFPTAAAPLAHVSWAAPPDRESAFAIGGSPARGRQKSRR